MTKQEFIDALVLKCADLERRLVKVTEQRDRLVKTRVMQYHYRVCSKSVGRCDLCETIGEIEAEQLAELSAKGASDEIR